MYVTSYRDFWETRPGSSNSRRTIAEHLHSVQSGRNSSGLLTVLLGRTDVGDCVSVLKLEREEGLRFKIDTDPSGRRTVDLELLKELTLTNKTKVFKTSLLMLASPDDPRSMYGRVSDDQRGRDDGVGVATFYLATFLGCQLKANPEKVTLDFVQTSERFFNETITNPEKTGRYQVALLAAMQDNKMDIRPGDFAANNLGARGSCGLRRGATRGRDRAERAISEGHEPRQDQRLPHAVRVGHGLGRKEG